MTVSAWNASQAAAHHSAGLDRYDHRDSRPPASWSSDAFKAETAREPDARLSQRPPSPLGRDRRSSEHLASAAWVRESSARHHERARRRSRSHSRGRSSYGRYVDRASRKHSRSRSRSVSRSRSRTRHRYSYAHAAEYGYTASSPQQLRQDRPSHWRHGHPSHEQSPPSIMPSGADAGAGQQTAAEAASGAQSLSVIHRYSSHSVMNATAASSPQPAPSTLSASSASSMIRLRAVQEKLLSEIADLTEHGDFDGAERKAAEAERVGVLMHRLSSAIGSAPWIAAMQSAAVPAAPVASAVTSSAASLVPVPISSAAEAQAVKTVSVSAESNQAVPPAKTAAVASEVTITTKAATTATATNQPTTTTATTPTSNDALPQHVMVGLPIFEPLSDVHKFIERFELHCIAHAVPPEMYVRLLIMACIKQCDVAKIIRTELIPLGWWDAQKQAFLDRFGQKQSSTSTADVDKNAAPPTTQQSAVVALQTPQTPTEQSSTPASASVPAALIDSGSTAVNTNEFYGDRRIAGPAASAGRRQAAQQALATPAAKIAKPADAAPVQTTPSTERVAVVTATPLPSSRPGLRVRNTPPQASQKQPTQTNLNKRRGRPLGFSPKSKQAATNSPVKSSPILFKSQVPPVVNTTKSAGDKVLRSNAVYSSGSARLPREPKMIDDILAELGVKDVVFDNSPYRITTGAPKVTYGLYTRPLDLDSKYKMFEHLTTEEVDLCASLHIVPEKYMKIKKTLLLVAKHYGPFKKARALRWFHGDVNAISIIYEWFQAVGWIPSVASDGWSAPRFPIPIAEQKFIPDPPPKRPLLLESNKSDNNPDNSDKNDINPGANNKSDLNPENSSQTVVEPVSSSQNSRAKHVIASFQDGLALMSSLAARLISDTSLPGETADAHHADEAS